MRRAERDAPAHEARTHRRSRFPSAPTGYRRDVTDYSEQGAVPVEDAAVPNPPTVDEVLARQREEFGEGDDEREDDAPREGATTDHEPPPSDS